MNHYVDLSATSDTHFDDPLTALAALTLQSEHEARRSREAERVDAQAAVLAEKERAVEHLRKKASSIAAGAWVSAAASTAGTALQAYGLTQGIQGAGNSDSGASRAAGKLWERVGCGLSSLSVIGSDVIGKASATRHEAKSQSAQTRAEASSGAVEALKEDRKKSEKAVEVQLDTVRNILEIRHQANMAMIGRV